MPRRQSRKRTRRRKRGGNPGTNKNSAECKKLLGKSVPMMRGKDAYWTECSNAYAAQQKQKNSDTLHAESSRDVTQTALSKCTSKLTKAKYDQGIRCHSPEMGCVGRATGTPLYPFKMPTNYTEFGDAVLLGAAAKDCNADGALEGTKAGQAKQFFGRATGNVMDYARNKATKTYASKSISDRPASRGGIRRRKKSRRKRKKSRRKRKKSRRKRKRSRRRRRR